jgi:predicted ATPase
MKITSVRIRNYKCYEDSGEIPLGPKCTVIVGPNNVGKTALLETLAPGRFQSNPHREPQTGEFPYVPAPNTQIQYQVNLSGAELRHRFLMGGKQIHIPVPDADQATAAKLIDDLMSETSLSFGLNFVPNGWTSEYPSHHCFPDPAPNRYSVAITATSDRRSWSVGGASKNNSDELPGFIGEYLQNSVYIFKAERLNIGESSIQASDELAPDASNLPSVLLQLPSKSEHSQFIHNLRQVFPTIFSVGARPISDRRAKIFVSMNHPDAGGPKAGVEIPLADSGTGVSQVLALLYVAITAPAARTIVIDEPNSFLHPGAAKKLLNILRSFEHQFIITTHSSGIIRTLEPDIVHLIEWNGLSAQFRTMESDNVADQRRILDELGVHLADVFGADNVLWVEGPTEAYCFPILLEYLRISAPATSIVPVIAPGDFGARKPKAKLTWGVYERISSGTALVPPALAFSFDKERRSEREMEDIRRQSKGVVRFLPRTTYENYLLDADAISALLTQIGCAMQATDISKKFDELREAAGAELEEWKRTANGAGMLEDLFAECCEGAEYKKTVHSVALTKWLLEHKPEVLGELLEYVRGLFA